MIYVAFVLFPPFQRPVPKEAQIVDVVTSLSRVARIPGIAAKQRGGPAKRSTEPGSKSITRLSTTRENSRQPRNPTS